MASSRPRVRLVLAVSLDGFLADAEGRADFAGREDREGLFALRAEADAVLCGARTVVAGDLALALPKRLRDARVRSKRTPLPIRAVVSGRLGVRAARRLLSAKAPAPWVFTTRAGEVPGSRVVRLRAPLRMRDVLASLARDGGVRLVQAEGGARLAAALFEEGLVDEWVLTVAPVVLGSGIRAPFPRTMRFRVARAERLGGDARIWMERAR